MFKSNTPGLRIYSGDRTRSHKFRAGVYDPQGNADAIADIEAFARQHPHYGIEKVSDKEGEALAARTPGQVVAETTPADSARLPATAESPDPVHPTFQPVDASNPEGVAVHDGEGVTETGPDSEPVEEQDDDEAPADAPKPARKPKAVAKAKDLEGMTVPELQELARQNDLKVGGNRADLVARLTGKE